LGETILIRTAPRTMADYSAVALSWFQAATELTPPTEEELRRLQEVFQEREQLLQMRNLLQGQLVRLISSTTQSHEEEQVLTNERRWLLNELAPFQSTDEGDTRSQSSQSHHLQMDGRPISPGPEEVPLVHHCSQQSQHDFTNSVMSTPQADPFPISWSAICSTIPGRLQQPGPEEIPWPQPRPQLLQRTRRNALESNSPTADFEQERGQSRCNRPSPLCHRQRSVAQSAQESRTRGVTFGASDNNSSRRLMRNAPLVPVAPPQPPHPQVALTADLPSGQAQSARNHQSQQAQANQRLQASPGQRPAAQNARPPPTAGIQNNGRTIGFILPSLPTAAPAA